MAWGEFFNSASLMGGATDRRYRIVGTRVYRKSRGELSMISLHPQINDGQIRDKINIKQINKYMNIDK